MWVNTVVGIGAGVVTTMIVFFIKQSYTDNKSRKEKEKEDAIKEAMDDRALQYTQETVEQLVNIQKSCNIQEVAKQQEELKEMQRTQTKYLVKLGDALVHKHGINGHFGADLSNFKDEALSKI